MDGLAGQQAKQARDRSRPRQPPYLRTASRSSTSSTQTRHTTVSAESSRSHMASSGPQTPVPTAQRFHDRTCNRSSTDRPRSRMSREDSDTPRQAMPSVSNFLQERLQKERRAESERSASRMSNHESVNASLEVGAAYNTPGRDGSLTDTRRPPSSAGNETKKKGLGLKEMELNASTLHKQNFDLKLELFHRRERQTMLEERMEKLESEKADMEGMNDKLIAEIEKRDRAVEEAVAMIVVLEARVEQLLKEREMVRHVEANDCFYSHNNSPTSAPAMSTPKTRPRALSKHEDDATRSLARMPSFLSVHSEATENLRNVYLGTRGSIVSLPKLTDDGERPSDFNVIRNPSLSVLSESSFLSVYGQPHAHDDSLEPESNPTSLDGQADSHSTSQGLIGSKLTPSRSLRRPISPRAASNGSTRFKNIEDILGMNASPLQKFEKPERALAAIQDVSQSTSPVRKNARPAKPPPSQARTKQEKRDALEKVLTNANVVRDLTRPGGAPPTPDTISTSTLRRFKNSDDNLSKEPSLSHDRGEQLAEIGSSPGSNDGETSTSLSAKRAGPSQLASTSAFNSRREFVGSGSYFESRHPLDSTRRPKSASETTVSYRRGGLLDDSDSDDSADDFLDRRESLDSSVDYWMRESLKPNRAPAGARAGALDPLSSASQVGANDRDRASPDLFSFPSSTGRWATDTMFGSLGGNGYTGATGAALAQTLDTLGDSLPTPLFGAGLASPILAGGFPPPPPNRRSSLHAQTGSTSTSRPGSGKLGRESAERTRSLGHGRKRSNSLETSSRPTVPHVRAPSAPPQQEYQRPPPASQKRHYPPTASQQPPPQQQQGGRARGLNNFFRRSIGSAPVPPLQQPSSAPATETSFKKLPAQLMVGVPSWGRRADLAAGADDFEGSATPPPIMRNRGDTPARRGSFDGGAPLDETGASTWAGSGGAPVATPTEATPQKGGGAGNGSGPAAPTATATPTTAVKGGDLAAGKRKWLGLGRVGSLGRSPRA